VSFGRQRRPPRPENEPCPDDTPLTREHKEWRESLRAVVERLESLHSACEERVGASVGGYFKDGKFVEGRR
jgi:hypothetical protein